MPTQVASREASDLDPAAYPVSSNSLLGSAPRRRCSVEDKRQADQEEARHDEDAHKTQGTQRLLLKVGNPKENADTSVHADEYPREEDRSCVEPQPRGREERRVEQD